MFTEQNFLKKYTMEVKIFEIKITERPKNLTKFSFCCIMMNCPNWTKNDLLEIEFLKRNGTVLKIRNIKQIKNTSANS